MVYIPVLLSCFLAAVARGETWSWAKSGRTCGGVIDPCTNASCATVGVGYCDGDSTTPDVYVKSEFVGIGLVKASSYLAECNTKEMTKAEGSHQDTCTMPPLGQDFYRDLSVNAEYGYTMSGAVFGDFSDIGGYLGQATYLNKGSEDIELQYNKFYVGTQAGMAGVERGDSDNGAPYGPIELCVVPLKNGVCGDAVGYAPGNTKFTLFGFIGGTNWASYYPTANYTDMLYRIKYTLVGTTADGVTFNGAQTLKLANLGNTNVNMMDITKDEEVIRYTFKKTYNYGSAAELVDRSDVPSEANPFRLSTPNGTKDVKIRVSAVPDSTTSVYVDYLFDFADFANNWGYFVYDPDVQMKTQGELSNGISFSMQPHFLMAPLLLLLAMV